MKRKMYKSFVLFLCVIALLLFSSCGKEKGPKQSPVPRRDIIPGSGRVWMDPEISTVSVDSEFKTDIFVNSGDQKIAAYGLIFNYSEDIITLNKDIGNNGVTPGDDGYVAALNNTEGQLFIAGYDVYGKGPGDKLHFLTINWRAVKTGETTITITVEKMVDETTDVVGKPVGISGKVVVE
jgi:hypothetical protein